MAWSFGYSKGEMWDAITGDITPLMRGFQAAREEYVMLNKLAESRKEVVELRRAIMGGDDVGSELDHKDYVDLAKDGDHAMNQLIEIVEREGALCDELAEAKRMHRDEVMAALLAEADRDQIVGLLDPVIAEIERQRVAAEERREAWWEEKQAECSACDDTGILSTAPDDPISFCTDCSEGRETKAMAESPILRKVLENLP